MRGSHFSTCFAVALLALACSASTAPAQWQVCWPVAAPVKNGQYYHGVKCVNPNKRAGCYCSGFYCIVPQPHYSNVTCMPLYTVK